MDNHYVPNLTIGPMVCAAIRPHVTVPIDVHLMVEPVDELVPMFAKAGADYISFHPEASRHVHRTLSLIREQGCKAGLVFNPATPLSLMDHVMDKIDLVLLMSVNPASAARASSPAPWLRAGARPDRRLDPGRRPADSAAGRRRVKIDNIAEIRRAGSTPSWPARPSSASRLPGIIKSMREQIALGESLSA